MAKKARLDDLFADTQELESFLHTFLEKLPSDLTPGEDVTRYAKKFGLKMPAALKGETIEWDGHAAHDAARAAKDTLVLARPGQADAVGLVIKCVKVKKWKFCLECGWLYCRIVVTRRF